MKKQYALEEFIDLLTQAKTYLERGDQVNATLAARQADLAQVDAWLTTRQGALASIDAEYLARKSALETAQRQQRDLRDREAATHLAQLDAAAAERTATHERIVRELQQQATTLRADVATWIEQAQQAKQHLAAVQDVLTKTKAEAQKFAALVTHG